MPQVVALSRGDWASEDPRLHGGGSSRQSSSHFAAQHSREMVVVTPAEVALALQNQPGSGSGSHFRGSLTAGQVGSGSIAYSLGSARSSLTGAPPSQPGSGTYAVPPLGMGLAGVSSSGLAQPPPARLSGSHASIPGGSRGPSPTSSNMAGVAGGSGAAAAGAGGAVMTSGPDGRRSVSGVGAIPQPPPVSFGGGAPVAFDRRAGRQAAKTRMAGDPYLPTGPPTGWGEGPGPGLGSEDRGQQGQNGSGQPRKKKPLKRPKG